MAVAAARRCGAGDVRIIRHEGPHGRPGMSGMLDVTALIYGQGVGEQAALLADRRFSGMTCGMCVGYAGVELTSAGA
jgi:dihydroxy-acid dehydratase